MEHYLNGMRFGSNNISHNFPSAKLRPHSSLHGKNDHESQESHKLADFPWAHPFRRVGFDRQGKEVAVPSTFMHVPR